MDLFSLRASLTLDSSGYEKGLDEAQKSTSGFGDKLRSGLATAGKVAGAAIGAASAAVGKLAKDAVDGYADYEQLLGGVETLFKTETKSLEEYAKEQGLTIEKAIDGYKELISMQDAVDVVTQNAANAYKTAGMSANEYMEQAVSYSTAMTQALGGDANKAAEMIDMAITDMSDNVNKMGISMESAQNAYRGLMMGNFRMLDNLKLGYQGSEDEMKRLLADAEAIKLANGEMVNYSIDNFADMVEAIHVIQDNLGITGTTAEEADKTISGSVASMKSAWKNLLVGMADPAADLSGLIGNVVETAETAFGNILPVAEQAIMGVATFVEEVAPVIAEKLPGVVKTVLPSILNAATSLVTALVDALPTIMEVLIKQGPVIINTLLGKILEMLPEIVALGLTLLTSLAMGIADNLDELVPAIVDVVLQIVETLTEPETLGNLIDAAIAIIIALANGIIASLPDLLEKAPEIIANLVQALVDNVPKLVESAIAVIVALTDALLSPENIKLLLKAALDIIVALADGIIALGSYLWDAAVSILEDFIGGIKERWQKFYDYVVEKGGLIAIIGEWLKSAADWGKDIINNFLEGLKQKWEDIKNWWEEIGGIKGIFQSSIDGATTWGSDLISNFIQGIKDGWNKLKEGVKGVAQGIKDFIGFSEPKEGPLSDFHTYAPDMMKLFAQGIKDNEHLITDQIASSFNFSDKIANAKPQRVSEAGAFPSTIVVQSVLDGRIIGETAYRYSKNRLRMVGG